MADLIVVVIDVKTHLERLAKLGLNSFLKQHLNESLKVDLSSFTPKKEVMIAFNKSDLLDPRELAVFEEIVNVDVENSVLVSKISCVHETIDELLNSLKTKLQNL